MGFLKNLLVGGSRPKEQEGVIRCGDCRETVQPDATRCPNCNAKIFTMRGRMVRRTAVLFGFLLLAGSTEGGILGILLPVFALALFGMALYYFVKRPVHSLRPPHRPERPEELR